MIAIIDYGAGNIFSVKNLDYLGVENKLTADKNEICAADEVILPGVGAFPWAMKMLRDSGLVDTIREEARKKPFLGICLGMQMAIVEFARHVLGYADAHSSELNPNTTHPVIHIMPDQHNVTDLGGTLRLGAYKCVLDENSKAYELYGEKVIEERHRHRYEVNNEYRDVLTENGMQLCGISPDGRIVEMIELKDHPWFVATQAHPEFKSRPNKPHPLFKGFVAAALEYEDAAKSEAEAPSEAE